MSITTLTRVGDFYGDFRAATSDFMPEMRRLPGTIEKYGAWNEKKGQVIIASNPREKLKSNYSVILTVTSEYPEGNVQTSLDFAAATKIWLRQAPRELERIMGGISLTFPIFRKHGKKSMQYLHAVAAQGF